MYIRRLTRLSSLAVMLIGALGFAACTTTSTVEPVAIQAAGPALPPINANLLEQQIAVREPDSLFALSQQHQQDFFAYFLDPINQATPRHERLANYLTIIMDRFKYEEVTLTAEQALQQMSGNCLSLAILTTAYARLAEVPIRYHFLENNPVFIFADDLLIRSDHIRSVLSGNWQEDESAPFQFRRDIRIDYFPTEGLQYVDNISEQLKISMYYSNRAVELIAADDYAAAFAHAEMALSISSRNASALNSLGVLHRRLGDLRGAETIYQRSAELFPDNPTFLRNLSQLLKQQSRTEEVAAIQQKISTIENRNPWKWLVAGRTKHLHGDYDNAIDFYKKALQIAPQMHQVQLYLAMAYVQAEDLTQAESHLQQAIQLSSNENTRLRYQRKLRALQQ